VRCFLRILHVFKLFEMLSRYLTFSQIGLSAFHENSYVHNDIKPDNIVLGYDYNLKLIDFGSACLAVKEYDASRMVL
jgi:serine/threonine protein kinase